MLNQIIEISYESFQNLDSSQNEKTVEHCEQLNENTDTETNTETDTETDIETDAEINTEINAETNIEINSEINSDASDTHINISVDYDKAINDKMTKHVNTFIQQLLDQNND